MYVAGRPPIWYALNHQFSPWSPRAPATPPHSPRPSRYRLLTAVVSQALIGGDGDSLRHSIDDLLSQVMLLTDEE
eukprot:2309441-Prymnesium_polylepis.1